MTISRRSMMAAFLALIWLVVPLHAQQRAEKPIQQKPRVAVPATRLQPAAVDLKRSVRTDVLSDAAYREILRSHQARVRERAVGQTAVANTQLRSQNDDFRGQYDCDDDNPAVFPGAPEVCDGIDNNCDGDVDENVAGTWYLDADGDGWGDASRPFKACVQADGYASRANDCDDRNPQAYPGACDSSENGIDENCNGEDGA